MSYSVTPVDSSQVTCDGLDLKRRPLRHVVPETQHMHAAVCKHGVCLRSRDLGGVSGLYTVLEMSTGLCRLQ